MLCCSSLMGLSKKIEESLVPASWEALCYVVPASWARARRFIKFVIKLQFYEEKFILTYVTVR